MTRTAAVVVEQVDVERGGRPALSRVNFALEPGSLTAVVGPNGAGKSSLFGVLSGRLQPTSGSVSTSGAVAEVLQSTAVDTELPLTVQDVVRMGRYSERGLLRRFRRSDHEIVDMAMEATGVMSLRRRSIHELSGGQRQRVLVAQGIAQRAPILLLDEPMAGLDVGSQRDLFSVIRNEADRGTTVLMATHDLQEASLADNLIVLACECVCCAPPVDAFADPAVTALFGPIPQWSRQATTQDARAG